MEKKKWRYGENLRDRNMTRSIPAQYPGITKMKRNGRASLEELQPYLKLQMNFFVETARRKTKK